MNAMYSILIIEDNVSKLEKVTKLCTELIPNAQITAKKSYNAALQEVVYNGMKYHVILLDVSMYTYDFTKDENGGEPEPLAGSNILRMMKLRHISTPVIVVTMYENFADGIKIAALDKKFREEYKNVYKGFVYYNVRNEDWKTQLNNKIKEVLL